MSKENKDYKNARISSGTKNTVIGKTHPGYVEKTRRVEEMDGYDDRGG